LVRFDLVQFGSVLLGLAWLAWFGSAHWALLAGLGLICLARGGWTQIGLTRRGHPIDDALDAIDASSIVLVHCLNCCAEADGIFG
jgi:hypothetical protein